MGEKLLQDDRLPKVTLLELTANLTISTPPENMSRSADLA